MRDLEFTESEKIELIYDVVFGILAVIAVLVVMLQFSSGLSAGEERVVNIADKAVYVIFVLDYFIRLVTCKNKKRFLKHNIVDLIAILPFGIFSQSTIGSAFKLIKVVAYLLRLIGNVKEVLFTNGFIYALGGTIIITIMGSFGIYIFEKGLTDSIVNYGDALWWSFVTVTTVGYGDISPSTTGGRFIACILMIAGIGFLSMLTSTISTFFFSAIQKKNVQEKKSSGNINESDCMIDLSILSEEDRTSVISYYEYIVDKSEKENTEG